MLPNERKYRIVFTDGTSQTFTATNYIIDTHAGVFALKAADGKSSYFTIANIFSFTEL